MRKKRKEQIIKKKQMEYRASTYFITKVCKDNKASLIDSVKETRTSYCRQ